MEQIITSIIASLSPAALPFKYNQHFVAMMNIINAARLNPPESGHKHHIVPRCWFKREGLEVDNSKSNLVLLSYDDHCKVHKLMTMCAGNDELARRYKFACCRLSGTTLGVKHTEEELRKMSTAHKGKKFTDAHKANLSKSNKGKSHGSHAPKSEEWKNMMSERMKGKATLWLTGRTSNAKGHHWKVNNRRRKKECQN